MPRLFTALEIPARIIDALSSLRGGLTGARWIDDENFHITLRFFGDVEDHVAGEIASQLRQVRRPDFELSLDGLGMFGNRRPRAIWARVTSVPALRELYSDLERRMQLIGLEAVRRKYTPHVTLARLRDTTPSDVATYLALRDGFGTPSFPVGRFSIDEDRNYARGRVEALEELMTSLLTGDDRRKAMADLPLWRDVTGRDAMARTFKFKDFNAAFGFMTRVAMIAETMDHHPEWSNVYNRVEVVLATHSAGGVTQKDIALAGAMEKIAGSI
ncbi:MAG: RNA 2',3'-cyclic phosphodiesterase [Alphaproteobacteria bacterium]